MSDFITSPKQIDGMDFWRTEIGIAVNTLITQIDSGRIPTTGIEALQDILSLHHGSKKISSISDFKAADQAVQLANVLNTAMNYYMPGGIIDESKASAADIKNLLSTASSIIKLIHTVQKDLYTSDRLSAMEKAVHLAFDTAPKEIGMSKRDVYKLKEHFREKLEAAFASL